MRMSVALLLLLATAVVAHADVTVSDADSVAHRAGGRASGALMAGHQIKSGEKSRRGIPLGTQAPQATGSQALIDASGVKYFINTNITFSTSSSASAAMSEASYTHAVAATTLNGGTVMSTLNDAYDGYNTLCLSLNNTVATCETGNANFVIYNKNGPATTSCGGREVDFPVQTAGSITMQRTVYVPAGDSFARWNNIVTNTGATPATVTLVIANNLGSDANTVIVSSSNGGTVDTSSQWVTTFQNYSGTTSSDPRLGHVLQGPGAAVALAGINFANGDDNPFWGYTLTLAPGETRSILNFAVVQPSKAAAAAKAASLVGLPAGTLSCMTPAQSQAVANFAVAHTVTPSVTGNGTISPNTPQTVNDGATTTFTLTPNAGNQIASVTGTCGGTLVGNTYTTNAITADCTVIANFTAITHTVTPSVTGTGSITPNTPQTVNDGGTLMFTLSAPAGTQLASVTGTCGGSLAGTTYTTNPITADCTVVANFRTGVSPEATPGPSRPLLALLAAMLAALGAFGVRRLRSSK